MLSERPPDTLLRPTRHTFQLPYPRLVAVFEVLDHFPHTIPLPSLLSIAVLDLIVPPLQQPYIFLHRQPFLLVRHLEPPKPDPPLGEIFLEKLVVPIILILQAQDTFDGVTPSQEGFVSGEGRADPSQMRGSDQ